MVGPVGGTGFSLVLAPPGLPDTDAKESVDMKESFKPWLD